MVTTRPTPERLQHQIEDLRILEDQIRFDLPLARPDLQGEWKIIERRLPDPTTAGAAPAITTPQPLDPLIEDLRWFRNRVRHDAGANRTLAAPFR
jgi:hypothetical protein